MATSGPKTMRRNPLDALSVESIGKLTSPSKQVRPRNKKNVSPDTVVAHTVIHEEATCVSSPVPVDADCADAKWLAEGSVLIIKPIEETPAVGATVASDRPLVVSHAEPAAVLTASKTDELFAQVLGTARDRVSRTETAPVSERAVEIVQTWAQWSVVGSLVPAPLIDSMLISAAQIKMIHALCRHYDVPFERKVAVAVASGLAGGTVTTTVAQIATRAAIKSMPLIGTLFTVAAEPALSYATTYGIGYAFIRHFEAKGTLANFTPDMMKHYFADQVERGKKIFRGNRPLAKS